MFEVNVKTQQQCITISILLYSVIVLMVTLNILFHFLNPNTTGCPLLQKKRVESSSQCDSFSLRLSSF
jgi:hypothetical protein